jgi:hypothetical protein
MASTRSLVVDVHCHTFNADDVPVRGFLRHVVFENRRGADALAQLIDAVVQRAAPGYRAEKAILDRLLGRSGFESVYAFAEAVSPPLTTPESLEEEVDATLVELQGSHPALLARLEAEVGDGAPGIERAALLPGPSGVRRAIRWATLFTKSRLELTRYALSLYGQRVALFTPLLVDLDFGVGDVAEVSTREQVELHEKISRLSMLGLLDSPSAAHVHPFVSFDPRRELRARLAGDIETPLDVVMGAVERYGFVGIKVYPPMGWRPIGNSVSAGMTDAEALHVDDILRELYTWCMREHVPITAHCNQSQYADPSYCDFASPGHWSKVLDEFPELSDLLPAGVDSSGRLFSSLR